MPNCLRAREKPIDFCWREYGFFSHPELFFRILCHKVSVCKISQKVMNGLIFLWNLGAVGRGQKTNRLDFGGYPDHHPAVGFLKGFFIYYCDSYRQTKIKHENPRLAELCALPTALYSFVVFYFLWSLAKSEECQNRSIWNMVLEKHAWNILRREYRTHRCKSTHWVNWISKENEYQHYRCISNQPARRENTRNGENWDYYFIAYANLFATDVSAAFHY